MSLVYLAAAIAFEICGTTALKLSFGLSRLLPTVVVATAYPLSFAALALALRGVPLSVAYAVWSGVGTAIVALIGIVWFDEAAGLGKLLSLVLIVAGVVGLHLCSRPA